MENFNKTMLRLKEASDFLSISERTLRNMMQARKIPYYKTGKFAYFDVNDLNEYLHHCRVATDSEISARAYART